MGLGSGLWALGVRVPGMSCEGAGAVNNGFHNSWILAKTVRFCRELKHTLLSYYLGLPF